jgi:hypothetical protein
LARWQLRRHVGAFAPYQTEGDENAETSHDRIIESGS